MGSKHLKLALFILRLSIAVFFFVWALEKFLHPETTAAIWKSFYLVDNFPHTGSYAIGVVQLIAISCFFFGILKFWSYGFLMVIHALSTASSYGQLLDPYSGYNHLFWAGVPTLAALVVLFIMRGEDTMLTITGSRKK